MLARTAAASRASARIPLGRGMASAAQGKPVNSLHQPDSFTMPTLEAKDNSCGEVSAHHWDDEWSKDELYEAVHNNQVFTWGAGNPVRNTAPMFVNGDGIYLEDIDGKKYMDWTCQAVCTNLGYTVPEAIQKAVEKQFRELPMVYGGLGLCPIRAKLCNLMAELCPADINGFLFPSGGGEANEAAIRIARRYTGKHKILSRYRSYHGGTTSTVTMTGDFRRWFGETGTSGFVKMFDPTPFGFQWAEDEEAITARSLAALEEQIMLEGPGSIAAVFLESIPGSGGVLIPPEGYMQGVRALCDKYDILLILDEVMVGFGRTGTMFGFQNFEGVVPDLVTFAKGISAAYLPLSGVGMRQPIKEFFDENALGWGATYQAHPVAMACGYEVMKHIIKEDLIGHAKSLEPVMIEELQKLVDNHSSIRQARAIGAFGCADIIGEDGQYIQMLHDKPSAKFGAFKAKLLELGIFGLVRPPLFHCAPALITTEEELRDGFAKVDEAFNVLDF